MAANSKIEWTHHTFNPWRGCTKVSPGCANCYAETLSKRNPKALGIWRDELFALIALTPHLDWLLLTKRPQHAAAYLHLLADPEERQQHLDWAISEIAMENSDALHRLTTDLRATAPIAEELAWPMPNVWIGTSVENQETADERIPHLLKCPAAARFLSCEPLLGPVDLTVCRREPTDTDRSLSGIENVEHFFCQPLTGERGVVMSDRRVLTAPSDIGPRIDWVIVGGESGPKARPMHPEWAMAIRDQCTAAGAAFFFKQWGGWLGGEAKGKKSFVYGGHVNADDLDDDPRFHQWPDGWWSIHANKHDAGRLLDGREWSEFPAVQPLTGVSA